jgi:hypothetical protein
MVSKEAQPIDAHPLIAAKFRVKVLRKRSLRKRRAISERSTKLIKVRRVRHVEGLAYLPDVGKPLRWGDLSCISLSIEQAQRCGTVRIEPHSRQLSPSPIIKSNEGSTSPPSLPDSAGRCSTAVARFKH